MPVFSRPARTLPSFADIRQETLAKLGKRPCALQVKVCDAILRRDKHVVCEAATGFGKTLTFWMPLLFNEDGIMIIVTALNILGVQCVEQLTAAGISAISVNAANATDKTFQDIKDRKYRAVIVNPEILMKPQGQFEKLWQDKTFVSKIMAIVFDEAHCITKWGSFRPEYREIERLRYILPQVPIYVTSATLATPVLTDISRLLNLNSTNTVFFHRSNDRPNVFYGVRKMKHNAGSFEDLDFLIPTGWKEGDPLPPKFLIFFDDQKEAERAAKHLKSRLPPELQDKVEWFHSIMTDEYREKKSAMMGETQPNLRELFGLCATDAFGMGVDISDIDIIVQWRVTCGMDALMQRFGRGARDPAKEAIALLIAEPEFFDEEVENVSAQAEASSSTNGKRKKAGNTRRGQSKRQATANATASSSAAAGPSQQMQAEDGSLPDSSSSQETDADEIPTVARARASNQLPAATGRKAKRVLGDDPLMDDFVNAGRASRPGVLCRRSVPQGYFKKPSQVTNEHLECMPESATGCARCGPKNSRVYCDLCKPDLFRSLLVSLMPAAFDETVADVKPVQGRSKIRQYEDTDNDVLLRKLLFEWRDRRAKDFLSSAVIDDLGYEMFFPDEIITRLVDCAHKNKITTADDIDREAKSNSYREFADEIIDIIASVRPPTRPPPLFTSTPLIRKPLQSQTPDPNVAAAVNLGKPKRIMHCSRCGEAGHNASNKKCRERSVGQSQPASGAVDAPASSSIASKENGNTAS